MSLLRLLLSNRQNTTNPGLKNFSETLTVHFPHVRILLYNPDNGVTRNFMPHLWMFLLQAITPPDHEVILIDANARAMSDDEIVQFVREQDIGLVGIGAMTRMTEKAYRVADAIRAAGVSVVMGGPHVTESRASSCLGRFVQPREEC